jgi:plasmid maintenance system antidote protein VapI
MEKEIKLKLIEKYGTIKNASADMGVSQTYLCAALKGRAHISLNLAFIMEEYLELSALEIMQQQLINEINKRRENESS